MIFNDKQWSIYPASEVLVADSEAEALLTRFPKAGMRDDSYVFVSSIAAHVGGEVMSEQIYVNKPPPASPANGDPLTDEDRNLEILKRMNEAGRSAAIIISKSEASSLGKNEAFKIQANQYGQEASEDARHQADYNKARTMLPGIPAYAALANRAEGQGAIRSESRGRSTP